MGMGVAQQQQTIHSTALISCLKVKEGSRPKPLLTSYVNDPPSSNTTTTTTAKPGGGGAASAAVKASTIVAAAVIAKIFT